MMVSRINSRLGRIEIDRRKTTSAGVAEQQQLWGFLTRKRYDRGHPGHLGCGERRMRGHLIDARIHRVQSVATIRRIDEGVRRNARIHGTPHCDLGILPGDGLLNQWQRRQLVRETIHQQRTGYSLSRLISSSGPKVFPAGNTYTICPALSVIDFPLGNVTRPLAFEQSHLDAAVRRGRHDQVVPKTAAATPPDLMVPAALALGRMKQHAALFQVQVTSGGFKEKTVFAPTRVMVWSGAVSSARELAPCARGRAP